MHLTKILLAEDGSRPLFWGDLAFHSLFCVCEGSWEETRLILVRETGEEFFKGMDELKLEDLNSSGDKGGLFAQDKQRSLRGPL